MKITLTRVLSEAVCISDAGIDLGRPRTFAQQPRPVALMWLNNGTEADAARARQWAADEADRFPTEPPYTVRCYPSSERDPLGRAKADALESHRAPSDHA